MIGFSSTLEPRKYKSFGLFKLIIKIYLASSSTLCLFVVCSCKYYCCGTERNANTVSRFKKVLECG